MLFVPKLFVPKLFVDVLIAVEGTGGSGRRSGYRGGPWTRRS
jgi:hypothetical protein